MFTTSIDIDELKPTQKGKTLIAMKRNLAKSNIEKVVVDDREKG